MKWFQHPFEVLSLHITAEMFTTVTWLLARFAREKSMTSCFSTDSFCPWATSQNSRPLQVALMREKKFFLCVSLHIFKELSSASVFISEVRSTSRRQPPCSQNKAAFWQKRVYSWPSSQSHKQRSCFLRWVPGFGGFPLANSHWAV